MCDLSVSLGFLIRMLGPKGRGRKEREREREELDGKCISFSNLALGIT